MPEFIADTDGTVNGMEWDDLSPFVQGYFEAMLFTNVADGISMVEWEEPENQEAIREGQADGSIPGDSGFGDIHPDSVATAIADCEAFQKEAEALLSEALGYTMPGYTVGDGSLPDSHRPARDYDEAAAGRDFWFTRCGHGVGYWDRDLPGELGDKLSDIARTYGNVDADFSPNEASPTGYGYVYLY